MHIKRSLSQLGFGHKAEVDKKSLLESNFVQKFSVQKIKSKDVLLSVDSQMRLCF